MDNHYHLFIETPLANLSKGMRQLNGVYTQWSNRQHDRDGHLSVTSFDKRKLKTAKNDALRD